MTSLGDELIDLDVEFLLIRWIIIESGEARLIGALPSTQDIPHARHVSHARPSDSKEKARPLERSRFSFA